MDAIDRFALNSNRCGSDGIGNGDAALYDTKAPCSGGDVIGPELMLARLGDRLGRCEVRDAIRDGLVHVGNHVAHRDVRHERTKQKGIAVPHGASDRAIAGKELLALGNMDVPTWHKSSNRCLLPEGAGQFFRSWSSQVGDADLLRETRYRKPGAQRAHRSR